MSTLTDIIAEESAKPVFPAARAMLERNHWQESRLAQSAVALARIALYLGVFSLAVLWLASGTHNPFIYFRF